MIRRLKFLIIPLFFLLLISGVTYYSIFVSKDNSLQGRFILQPSKETQVQLSQRLPASTELKNQKPKKIIIYDCLKKNDESLVVQHNNIFIKFLNCSVKQPDQIQILNQSNGYMAQIFKVQNNEYLSDFIQLKKGINTLKIDFSLNDKQTKTQIIIIEQKLIEIQ